MLNWLSAAAGLAFILIAVLVWAALHRDSKPICISGVMIFAFWGAYIFTVSVGLWDYVEPLTSIMLYVTVAWLVAHFGKLIVDRGV